MNDRVAELIAKMTRQAHADQAFEASQNPQAGYLTDTAGRFIAEPDYTVSADGRLHIYAFSLVPVEWETRRHCYRHRLDMTYRSLRTMRVPHWHRTLAQRIRAKRRKRSRQ